MNGADEELQLLIKACIKGVRKSQKELYQRYYAYALNICMHYAKNREEAAEILNDGFFKVFNNLDKYDPSLSFKGWLRKLLINVFIDYYRRFNRNQAVLEILPRNEPESDISSGFDQLSLDDLLSMIQQLTPMYRIVFNLYVIEGHKHHEIAQKLGISIGASKSNLARAKARLQMMIIASEKRMNQI